VSTVPPSVRVSVVVFRPDIPWLDRTFASLARSCSRARADGVVGDVAIDVVDNGSPDEVALDACIARLAAATPEAAVRTVRGHGNVGYGEGHNLSILNGREDVHLVLNPDVEMAEDALGAAMRYLAAEPSVALVAPEVRGPDGEQQFLCRREPSVLVLLVRGFAPPVIANRFRRRLARYEMRDVLGRGEVVDVPLASGCCMFTRGSMLRAVHGFSPAFFLYFEDYDLSARLREVGALRYVPGVMITHAGGNTARRGWRFVRLFLASAAKYFSLHGWRWI
jgi:GT2 family glycosyltransferase